MQRLESRVESRGEVAFPSFLGERIYMEPFLQSEGLPARLSRWQSTIDQMLVGVRTDQPIYLMVDQTRVGAGTPQRRPGIHIDGYWQSGRHGQHECLSMHRSTPPGHGSEPSRNPPVPDRHAPIPRHSSGSSSWADAEFTYPEGIILAASVSAARAFSGPYVGPIRDGGDSSEVDVTGLTQILMQSGRAYAGNVCFLHESLPVTEACLRTLVRLNVPGWSL